MINRIDLRSWEDCKAKFKEIQECRTALFNQPHGTISELLYRGQPNTKPLTTTLERYVDDALSLEDYYKVILATKSQIAKSTGKIYKIPTLPDFRKWLKKAIILNMGKIPGYKYMIYLRHHGFPSPLLDWTRSPFIASYFAFRNIDKETKRKRSTVSIYAYLEYSGVGKSYGPDEPWISCLGSHIKAHRRHSLQQSQYTICAVEEKGVLRYARYENAFSKASGTQDILWQITIPASESIKALFDLDKMDINAFSLFKSEESLMTTVALRKFYLKKSFP